MIDYNDYIEDLKKEMGEAYQTQPIQFYDMEPGYDYSWLMNVSIKNSLRFLFPMVMRAANEGLHFKDLKLVKVEGKNKLILEYIAPFKGNVPEQPFTPIDDSDDDDDEELEGIPLNAESEWGNASEQVKDAALDKLSNHLNGDNNVA